MIQADIFILLVLQLDLRVLQVHKEQQVQMVLKEQMELKEIQEVQELKRQKEALEQRVARSEAMFDMRHRRPSHGSDSFWSISLGSLPQLLGQSEQQTVSLGSGASGAQLTFGKEAEFWRDVVLRKLWNEELGFFGTLSTPAPPSPPRPQH